MKTVFNEDINIEDEVMYIYKAYGVDVICFGKVLDIENIGENERLKVQKTHEILYGKWETLKEVNKVVRLTNPIIFKCNKTLLNPSKKI